MKKKYLLYGVLAAAAIFVSGCGSNASADTAAEATTEAAGEQSSSDNTATTDGTSSISVDGLKTTTLLDVDVDKLVQLGDYKGITVEASKTVISDKDVEDALSSTYSANPQMVEVTDRAIESGDTANIDYEGKYADTKEAFQGGTAQGYDLGIGSGQFIDGFEDGLIGVKAGETVDLNLTFPENYGSSDLAGKDVIFTVKVNSIKKAAEEPSDEWVAGLGLEGVGTLEEFKAHLRTDLETEAEESYNDAVRNTAVNSVVDNATVDDVPEELYNRYFVMVYNSVDSYVQQLQAAYGMQISVEDYVQNIMQGNGISGEPSDYLSDIANQQAKRCLVLQAIANKEGIEITDEMIDTFVQDDFDKYFYQAYSTIEEYKATFDAEDYREQIMAEKVADFIVENATVVEP